MIICASNPVSSETRGGQPISSSCARGCIPYYRLPLDYPELEGIGRLTLLQSLRCVRLALWDEGQKRLVSFREVRRHYTSV